MKILPRQGETVAAVLDRNRGIGPGFDLLRVILALMVFFVHTKYISDPAPIHVAPSGGAHAVAIAGQLEATGGWLVPIRLAILPMFFALSGFLVAGSAFRLKKVPIFLAFRVLRLWPALITEITLSAFILGPIFTRLPIRDYLSNGLTWSYFGNLIGDIKYTLPGVFEHQAVSIVNLNLWTLPAEFYCYAATAALLATGILTNRKWFTAALIAVTCVFVPLNAFTNFAVMKVMVSEVVLVYYFMVGVAMYHWRDKIVLSTRLVLLAALWSFVMLEFRHTVFLVPAALVYCTVWFGTLAIPKLPVIRTGDYSYGIYLYGFPICQACMALMPSLVGHRYQLFFIGAAATSLFAIFSWHCIEKPSLRFKNRLPDRLFSPAAHIPVQQEPSSSRTA